MQAIRLTICCLLLLSLLGTCFSPLAEQWEFLANVPGTQYTYDLMTTPTAVYMVLGDSLDNPMGLYRYGRQDGQIEFVDKPGEPLYGVHVAGEDDEHIWLGSRSAGAEPDTNLWHSSDSGETWTPRVVGIPGDFLAVSGSRIGDRLYTGSHSLICFMSSTDYGETWTSWGGCTNHLYGTRAIEVDRIDTDRAYMIVMDWGLGMTYVYETLNVGQDWTWVYEDMSAPAMASVYPSPFASGDFGVVNDGGRLSQRIDGEWSILAYANLMPVYGIAQPIWDWGTWWIAGMSLGDTIRVGRNAGGGWFSWEEGLPRVGLDGSDINYHRARLWACPFNGDVFLSLPSHGLWVYRNPSSASPEISHMYKSPRSWVYPNPSHGRVSLALADIPGGTYEITIYDVLGRKVTNLYEGPLGGSSVWRWDGRDMAGHSVPQGLYFLQLADTGGKCRLSKKIILLGQ